MWIIVVIVIVILIIIIWGNDKNQNVNENIRKHYNNMGGLKSDCPNFVNILENDFKMILKYDDGRQFCYKKTDVLGELNIGIKLGMNTEKIMFSAIIKNGNTQIGDDVLFLSDIDNVTLKLTIEKCIKNLKISINTEITLKIHSIEWQKIISKSNNDNFIFEHIKELFTFDDIDPKKFFANLYYRKIGFNLDNDDHTPSIIEIHSPPKGFTNFFICAYPDVYLWCKENSTRIDAYKGLENEKDEYFTFVENIIPMYRSMINQFKKECNQLECR